MVRRRSLIVLMTVLSAVGVAAPVGHTTTAAPIRPVFGDWEGRGPFGLRLSFALIRHGGQAAVSDLSLGLPVSCRARGAQTWDAGLIAPVEYLAPGTVLHGPFPPLGPRQFELFLPPTKSHPFTSPFLGSLSSARRGVLGVPSWTQYGCHRTAWPRTLGFALTATRRVHVADGLWRGAITAPAGMTGSVRVRVVAGGRIVTDIAVTYTCPPAHGGTGNWELGPLPSTGYLIAANGSIGGTRATETEWQGRFGSHGLLSGTFTPPPCLAGTGQTPRFTARPAG